MSVTGNRTIDVTIEMIVEIAVNKAVKKVFHEYGEENSRHCRNYYKLTEKALYAIPQLRAKLEQDKLDIADLEREDFNQTSDWHTAKPPGGPKIDDEIRHKQKIARSERTMKRTQLMLAKIENALKVLENDDDYPIIRMRYIEHKTNAEIAEALSYHESTIARRKNRLMNKLQIVLFGAEVLEL
ncbi:MAG: hypothetical protein WC477_06135 [Patescibacteria group bacterium]